MKQKFTLVLVIVLLCVSKFNYVKAQINVQDSLALVNLYNSTNGAQWFDNTNWLSKYPVSTWIGVGVNNNRVISISLSHNNLSGALPSSLGRLTNLDYIVLDDNYLSGSIPDSIGYLTNVTAISFSSNQLIGSIPSSIGNLSNLATLELKFNKLSGAIPTSVNKLSKMYSLSIRDNNLTGNISFLTKLSDLRDIDLSGNQLSGKIPALKNANLGSLLLSHNQLSGSIPTFGNVITSYIQMDFSYNNLTGSINHQFDSLANLSYLILNNNLLTGKIPASLNKLVNLSILNLSNNKLNGKIPSLDSFRYLNELYLSNNKLSGEIPSSLNNNSFIFELDLSNNELSGKIPSLINLTNLDQLNLQNNQFTFTGLENIATTFPFATYSPQANINIQQNGNVLSVSAGGTLANNTYNWYKNGVLFKTKTGNAHLTINSNGNYSVDVRNAVATTLTLHSDTINYTMFTSLSNDQVNNQDKILKAQLYPNPAKTNTTLSFNADGKYSITITDVSGKILQTRTGVTTKGINTIQLDVSKYASGIYLITIVDEKNRKQTVRLSKE